MILTLVLIARSGCDLMCQHAEETRAAASSHGAVPACHDAGENQTPTQKQSHHHEIPKDCAHPQAVGDGPKFETKVVKPTQAAIAIEFPLFVAHFGINALTIQPAVGYGIKPPGPATSPSVLRI